MVKLRARLTVVWMGMRTEGKRLSATVLGSGRDEIVTTPSVTTPPVLCHCHSRPTRRQPTDQLAATPFFLASPTHATHH